MNERLYKLIDDWGDEMVTTDNENYDLGYLSGISHCMFELHKVLEQEKVLEGLRPVIEHEPS
jgi:hypothetical protein